MTQTTPHEDTTDAPTRDTFAMLAAPLDPRRVKQRDAGGGRMVPYLEGFDLIAAANAIFGFDGWSYRIDECRPTTTAHGALMYAATCTVEALGVRRTDVGFGIVETHRRGGNEGIDTPQAHETAFKGAATDALKRALRSFGEQFGNELYDKGARDAPREAPRGRGSDSAPRNDGPENGTGANGTPRTVGDFLAWAKREHGLDRSQVFRILNVKAPAEITDLHAAAAAITDARKGQG